MIQRLGIRAKLYSEGIYKSKKGKITAKLRIIIMQQDNLKKFAKIVNFNLINKQNKLKQALESYIVNERPNGEGEKHAIDFLNKVYKEKGYFTFGDLGRDLVRIGKTYDLAGRYLKKLIKKGTIQKIKWGI